MDDEVAAGGCRILIGESTYRHVAELVHVRNIGSVHLKGREKTVVIHAVLGPAERAAPVNGEILVSAKPLNAGPPVSPVGIPFRSESKS